MNLNTIDETLTRVQETAQQVAGHGTAQEESIGDVLLHHVQNSREIDLLFWKIELPHLPSVFGVDLSISKHVVML